MEFFKIRRTIPFMRHALIFNVISLITFIAAVFFIAHRGLNLSIEFTGGTLIEVGYKESADVDAVRRLVTGPHAFGEHGVGMRGRDSGNTRRVIRVTVCHEYSVERRVILRKRALECNQMIRVPDAGVDENSRASSNQQIGLVARSRHRAWIARVENDRAEHCGPA